MAEREIDLVLRARAITQAAFAEVDKQLGDLGVKSKTTGDQSKAAGQGLFEFSKSTKESFSAMGQAVGLAGGAVLALGAGIVALGIKGADVADVRGSFDALNKTIGNDSTKVLGTLRTAFAGTRTDFDLMKSVNVALSSGLKASATDFGLLGESARVLSDRGLGPAEQHFDTLTKAMATGKLKQAELIIGNIDAGRAYFDYGLKIGKAKDALTEAEKITATSIAITQRLQDSVMAGGLAQFDFADAVDASKVMLGNFVDALGEAIATSPVVNAMLVSFQKGLQAAFGLDQAALVQTLTGYVNKFAIFLVDVASTAMESARFIGNAFFGLEAAFNAVLGFMVNLGAGFVDLELTAANAIRAMTLPGLRGPVDENIATLKDLKTYMGGVGESFTKSGRDALDSAATWNKGLDTVGKGLGEMRGEMVKAMTATADLGEKQKETGGHTKTLETRTAELTKEQKKAKEDAEKAAKAMLDWSTSIKELTAYGIMPGGIAIKDFDTDLDKLSGNTYGVTKKMDDWARSIKDLTAFGILPGGIAISDLDTKLAPLPETVKGVALNFGELAGAFGTLAQVAGGAFGGIVKEIGIFIANIDLAVKASDTMKKGWDQIADAQKNGTSSAKNTADGFMSIAAGAVTLAAALEDATDKGTAFQRAMSGAATGAAAGWMGALLGASLGLARAWDETRQNVNAAQFSVKQFEIYLANTLTTQQKMETNGESWKMTVVAVRDAYLACGKTIEEAESAVRRLWDTDAPEHARKAIEEINGVLEQQKKGVEGLWTEYQKLLLEQDGLRQKGIVTWQEMGEAAKRYGIDLASLGPKFQSGKLDDAFKNIWNDFTLLTKGGADVGGVLLGMKDEIINLAREALTFGVAIPSNFKPLIDSLLASNQLTNDERSLLEQVGKEDFGSPVKSNFDLIADSMADVAKRIGELVDLLGLGLPRSAADGAQNIDRSLGIVETGVKDVDTALRESGWQTYGQNGVGVADGIRGAFGGARDMVDQVDRAVRNIPRHADIVVDVNYNDPGWTPPDGGEISPNPDGFAVGGIVNAGAGMTVRVHGREAIVPLDRPSVIGHQLIREIVSVSDRRGGGGDERRIDRIEDLIDRLVADNATRDGRIARAMRDALLQAGGQ